MMEEAGETFLLKGQGHWSILAGLEDYPLSIRNNIGWKGHTVGGNTCQIQENGVGFFWRFLRKGYKSHRLSKLPCVLPQTAQQTFKQRVKILSMKIVKSINAIIFPKGS